MSDYLTKSSLGSNITLLKNQEFLKYAFDKDSKTLNGKHYEMLSLGPNDLSYCFNTDGCQATNSSKLSIWPVYLAVNELPIDQRNKHMLLVGVWVHERQPNIKCFLRPIIIINELNELQQNGIIWNHRNEVKTTRIFPNFCSVDSCARSMMLNNGNCNKFF